MDGNEASESFTSQQRFLHLEHNSSSGRGSKREWEGESVRRNLNARVRVGRAGKRKDRRREVSLSSY